MTLLNPSQRERSRANPPKPPPSIHAQGAKRPSMDLEEVGGAQRRRVEAANQLAKSGNRSYAPLVRRSEVTRLLSSHQDELDRLGVTSLLVFGSVARDEAGPDSDVDLIAEFNHSVGYLELSRVQRELEKFLGCRVVR